MKNFLDLLIRDRSGVTSIEYAMIAAGIATAIIAAVNTLGNTVLTSKFEAVKDSFK
jgi:pilus assembly protein Flp/PilA